MHKYSNNLLPECIAKNVQHGCQCNVHCHEFLRNGSIHEHNTQSIPGAKTFSNISARFWNVLTNKINCDVSMSMLTCNLKLFVLHNEFVLNYQK